MLHPDVDWAELEAKNIKPPKPRKYKKGLVNLQPAGVCIYREANLFSSIFSSLLIIIIFMYDFAVNV